MKKDKEWLKEEVENMPRTRIKREGMEDYILISKSGVLESINQLDEPEVLSLEEEQTPETVARVLVNYLIASAKLKLALSMEVEELEE